MSRGWGAHPQLVGERAAASGQTNDVGMNEVSKGHLPHSEQQGFEISDCKCVPIHGCSIDGSREPGGKRQGQGSIAGRCLQQEEVFHPCRLAQYNLDAAHGESDHNRLLLRRLGETSVALPTFVFPLDTLDGHRIATSSRSGSAWYSDTQQRWTI